jgi:hypothetical protein
MRRFADFNHPINEPTVGGKLAVLLFISICVIGGGLMLGVLLASVSRMT